MDAFAITLHRGPAHVCIRANDLTLSATAGRQLVGVPVREAFPEPMYAPIHDLMDACYRTGQEQWATFNGSPIGILPRRDGLGNVIGVSTCYRLPTAPRLRPLPVRLGDPVLLALSIAQSLLLVA